MLKKVKGRGWQPVLVERDLGDGVWVNLGGEAVVQRNISARLGSLTGGPMTS